MSDDKKAPVALDGPDVIHFINEHQANPELLEELAASVVRAEDEHARQLGVTTTSMTFLREEPMRVMDREELLKGYAVKVCFFKADDVKDPSGWKEVLFFLPADEAGKITSILELGEQPIVAGHFNVDELGEAQ